MRAAASAVGVGSIKAAVAATSGAIGGTGSVACQAAQHSQICDSGAAGASAAGLQQTGGAGASVSQPAATSSVAPAGCCAAAQLPHHPDGKARMRLQSKASGWGEKTFIELRRKSDEPFYAAAFSAVSEIFKHFPRGGGRVAKAIEEGIFAGGFAPRPVARPRASQDNTRCSRTPARPVHPGVAVIS